MTKKMATPRTKRDRKAEFRAVMRAVIAFWPIWLVATLALTGQIALRYWPQEWHWENVWNDWFKNDGLLPAENIHVHGAFHYLNAEAVRAMVRTAIRNDVIQSDLMRVREHLLRNPWIREVRIKRRPPADLDVFVDERMPLARWRNEGLIDVNGEVFLPKNLPDNAPVLQVNTPKAVVREALTLMRQAIRHLSTSGLQPVAVSADALGTWRIKLAHGVELVLGRSELEARLRRVANVWPYIVAQGQPQSLDLRYKHGIAVRYAASSETSMQEKSYEKRTR